MNYFLLAETDFFRLINEAGDCNMETAYTAFATQVIELCNGGMEDCRLRQQGSVFRKKDAEIPCHAPSATTNIRQQRLYNNCPARKV